MIKRTLSKASLLSSASLLLAVGMATSSLAIPSGGVGGGGSVPAPVPPAAPIVEERPPLTPNTNVNIPIVVAPVIPTVTREPVPVRNVVSNPSAVQSNSVFDRRPVEPVQDVIVGGIPAGKKDDLPFTTVSGASNKRVEVQVAEDVPTTIFVSRLQPRATAQVTIIGENGRRVSLGRFRVTASGELELPPLTLGEDGKTIQIQVRVGDRVRTITVRS